MLKLKYKMHIRRTSPRKNGYTSVIFNIHYRNQLHRLFSGISVMDSQWNEQKECVKQGVRVDNIPYTELNKRLRDEEQFIIDYFDSCMYKEVEPSMSELKKRFNDTFNCRDSRSGEEFYYYFEQFIETQAKSRAWNQSMIDKYKRIEKGLQANFPKLKFSDLSVNMMQKILEVWSKGLDGQGTYNDHISATLSCFRSFVTWAKSKGCIVNEEFFAFRPKLRPAIIEPRYLTVNEVKQISDLDLSQSDSLDMVRDFFLFQCGTALRYSDLKKLKKSDITLHDDGRYHIKMVTQKNKKPVNFPISMKAQEIYLKYKDNPYPNNVVFPVISNQKYNEHLKTLGERAGLSGEWVDHQWRLDKEFEIRHPKKDLGTHVARRTFISTVINEGVSPELIALVTSHSDLKEMAPYIGLSPSGAIKVTDAIDEAYRD